MVNEFWFQFGVVIAFTGIILWNLYNTRCVVKYKQAAKPQYSPQSKYGKLPLNLAKLLVTDNKDVFIEYDAEKRILWIARMTAETKNDFYNGVEYLGYTILTGYDCFENIVGRLLTDDIDYYYYGLMPLRESENVEIIRVSQTSYQAWRINE